MTREKEIILLLLIVVAGLCLRLSGWYWGEGYHGAIGDEIGAYRVALEFRAGKGEARYIGQPNFPKNGTGHLPGPLWALLWSIPLQFGGGPEAMIVLIAVLNTLVIFLVYVLAEKVVGRPYALWAALFYATSPWPVYSSVGCWNPQVMGILGALLCLALWSTVTRPHSPSVFWVCVLLAMMPQFHMSGVFLVPSVLIILGLRLQPINRNWLAAGLLASVLLYVPYVWGEAHHHWDNTRRMFGANEPFTFGCLKGLTHLIVALSNLVNSAGTFDFRSYIAFGHDAFGSFGVLGLFNLLSLGLGVWAVAGFVVALFQALRGKWLSPQRAFGESTGLVFSAVLLFLPLLVFIPTGHNFSSRYMVALYPLLAVLPAMLVVNASARWRQFVLAGTALTIGFNVVLVLALFRYQERRIAEGDYFVPSFRKMEMVRERLQADAGAGTAIRMDTSAFPRMGGDEQAVAVRALAQYVDVRERFDPSIQRSRSVQVYRAERLANLVDTRERVVYQGNGMALLKWGSEADTGSLQQ